MHKDCSQVICATISRKRRSWLSEQHVNHAGSSSNVSVTVLTHTGVGLSVKQLPWVTHTSTINLDKVYKLPLFISPHFGTVLVSLDADALSEVNRSLFMAPLEHSNSYLLNQYCEKNVLQNSVYIDHLLIKIWNFQMEASLCSEYQCTQPLHICIV